MRFSIQRESFLKPLRAVAGVLERHNKQAALNPILGHVFIRVQNQRLSLITTDQEVELFASTLLKDPALEEGETTLSMRKLLDICVALPEAQMLSFQVEKGRCILCAGRSRLTLSTLEAPFPALSEDLGDLHFSINKNTLRHLIAQTEFAMAEKDVRAYLNGMLWEIKDQKLYQVAADGHRLAFVYTAINVQPGSAIRVLVPRKAIVGLQRILLQRGEEQQAEESIQISLGARHIRAEMAETRLSSGLLESNFPDFLNIIHKTGDKILLIAKDQLKEGLQRAAALLGDRSSGVSFGLSEGSLKILARNTEQDEIEDDLIVDYKGPPLVIGFNLKYLMDFLNVLSTEMLRFSFSDANSSAHLVGVGESKAAYVIMPMSI